jgi:hypothetical protein
MPRRSLHDDEDNEEGERDEDDKERVGMEGGGY